MPAASMLVGYVPTSVSPDGSQVFDGIPCRIRRPDGTLKTELGSIKVRPIPQTHPVLDE
jgi:hypothetical protein